MARLTSRHGWIGAGAVLLLGSSLVVSQVRSAGAAPEAKAEPAKPAATAAPVKLTKPWSDLTTLSEDQKQKIHEIHVKALAQVNEIEKQEKADIMALLTDAQKSELKEAAAKERKTTTGKATAAGPTTAPGK